MKRILLTISAILVLGVTAFSQNDAITKYFDKYMDDERFSMVYISPKLFEMVAKIDLEVDSLDPDIMEIVEELNGLRILSYDGEGAMDFYKEAQGKFNLEQYESLIEARDDGENIKIMTKDDGDYVQELLLLVGGDTTFALLSFTGNIDLKKVGKLGSALNINGSEHLQKLEEK